MNPIPISQESIFNMEPLKLADALQQYVEFPTITSIDTPQESRSAVLALNRTTAYICYFREMETIIRIKKREARAGKDRKEADRLLGLEEVFETFKKISEQQYEYISKMMTMKRLGLDEAKIMGKQT